MRGVPSPTSSPPPLRRVGPGRPRRPDRAGHRRRSGHCRLPPVGSDPLRGFRGRHDRGTRRHQRPGSGARRHRWAPGRGHGRPCPRSDGRTRLLRGPPRRSRVVSSSPLDPRRSRRRSRVPQRLGDRGSAVVRADPAGRQRGRPRRGHADRAAVGDRRSPACGDLGARGPGRRDSVQPSAANHPGGRGHRPRCTGPTTGLARFGADLRGRHRVADHRRCGDRRDLLALHGDLRGARADPDDRDLVGAPAAGPPRASSNRGRVPGRAGALRRRPPSRPRPGGPTTSSTPARSRRGGAPGLGPIGDVVGTTQWRRRCLRRRTRVARRIVSATVAIPRTGRSLMRRGPRSSGSL